MALHERLGRRIIDRAMRFEPIGLILLAVAAGGLFVFLQLSDKVLDGATRGFDESLLLMLRSADDPSMPLGPYWMSHGMNDITALGGTAVLSLTTVLVTVYLVHAGRRAIALFTFLCVVGGWMLSAALKLAVARPRSDIVPHLVEVHDLSFPSGHAMLSAVTYLTLGALLSRAEPTRETRIYMMGVAVFLTL